MDGASTQSVRHEHKRKCEHKGRRTRSNGLKFEYGYPISLLCFEKIVVADETYVGGVVHWKN